MMNKKKREYTMINDEILKEMTKSDFDQAYQKALFSRILSRLKGETNSLLSFQEIMQYIKVKNESYIGMQCVKIDDIIGSEGRYNDFNKEFLPKRKMLRSRWEKIDEAHYQDKILPPIKLYKLGEAYFVRDGNHRVSVARKQNREFIDAEVIEIKSNIPITPETTKSELLEIVISFEKIAFLELTKLDQKRDTSKLNFTFPGRYDELMIHIHGHQYFLGIEKKKEIDMNTAILSWYDNLYVPIINAIEEENLLYRFPGRTSSDLYVWIIRHWDDLKRKYGNKVKITDAVRSYSKNYGTNPIKHYMKMIKNFLFKR